MRLRAAAAAATRAAAGFSTESHSTSRAAIFSADWYATRMFRVVAPSIFHNVGAGRGLALDHPVHPVVRQIGFEKPFLGFNPKRFTHRNFDEGPRPESAIPPDMDGHEKAACSSAIASTARGAAFNASIIASATKGSDGIRNLVPILPK